MAKGKLIKIDDKKSLMDFLQAPTIKIAETLTGIFVSEKKDWKLSAGKLVQASLKNKLLTQLGKELKEYQEKGKIKEDYFATNKNQASLYELLQFIDEEVPDEERIKAMKSIFFTSISKEATEKDEELAYQLMQICKQLSSGEILVLKAAWDISNGKMSGVTTNVEISADNWLNTVARYLNHNIPHLVEIYEKRLIELNLLTGRRHSDRSGVEPSQYFRLTTLGKKLCEFITRYE